MKQVSAIRLASKVPELVTDITVLTRTGLLRPVSADVLLRTVLAVAHHGVSPAAAYEYGAARFGGEPAVIDERGRFTFSELAKRIDSLSAGLRDVGIGDTDRVGLLCRNHHELIEAIAALSSVGADIVLLNVSFAAPQLASVSAGQGLSALIYDEEFEAEARSAGEALKRVIAWTSSARSTDLRLGDLDVGSRPQTRVSSPPRSPSRYVLLTSGTTGAPRGATRPVPTTVDPLVALVSRIPLRSRDVTLIASPIFHAWGFVHLALGMVLSSTIVVRRRFDPEAVLGTIEQHRARVLVAIPFMLQSLLEIPAGARKGYDLSSLEVVISSGSPLYGGLATRFMDAYGDILYNVYASTEAGFGAIATPRDLRAAPATAGFAPPRTRLRITDNEGLEVPRGHVGRIFVKNELISPDYYERSTQTLLDGYIATGDLGHLDGLGRLYVDGREDDMVISGGENVYPQEVEDLLLTHPAIADAAVVGVPDSRYGERLKALVVLRDASELSAGEVRMFVRGHLARYKVPRDVRFVDALARNETGKLLHKARLDKRGLR